MPRLREVALFVFAQAPPVFAIQPFPNARAAAFLLNPSTAVTALHAVRRERPPEVAGKPTSLHRCCEQADLAILSLSQNVSEAYATKTRLTKPSSTRYTIHSPYAEPIEASLLRIDTALIAFSGAFVPALTLSCKVPIPRGWSGSPVVDECCRVVGMIVQSRGCECHAIPCEIIAYVHNHGSAEVEIGHIRTSEFEAKLGDEDVVHSINGYSVSADGYIDWGVPAPLQAAVYNAAHQKVDCLFTRKGMDETVEVEVGTAGEAAALRGRRGWCVVAGEYVMEAVSVELLENRYGDRWGGADLVEEVLCEGDEVVVFVRDAGENLLFEKIERVDGRAMTGLGDVVDGGMVEVGNRIVCVPKGKVRRCFVSEW